MSAQQKTSYPVFYLAACLVPVALPAVLFVLLKVRAHCASLAC